jgi:hypothetical protein
MAIINEAFRPPHAGLSNLLSDGAKNCYRYCGIAALVFTVLLPACRPAPVAVAAPGESFVQKIEPPISRDVRRLAVFYFPTSDHEWSQGYLVLEQAVFQLKICRPELRVLDRRDVRPVAAEQRWHLSGHVSDETAARAGQMLGADSIVLFRIEGPGWRERLLARMHGTMPPVVVTSKIVRVETGEVLYHDVVSAVPIPGAKGWEEYSSDLELQPLLRIALEVGVAQTIAHLERAFR